MGGTDLVAAQISAMGEMERRVFNYLSSGLNAASAAAAAGCSVSYVSQLMSEPEFKQLLGVKAASRAERYYEMDDLADKLQLQALQQIDRVLRYETKVPVLLAAVAKLDLMKRRSVGDNGAHQEAATVTIQLPTAVAAQYTVTVNSDNTVVQIGDATMLAATGRILDGMVTERRDNEAAESANSGAAFAALSTAGGTPEISTGQRPVYDATTARKGTTEAPAVADERFEEQ